MLIEVSRSFITGVPNFLISGPTLISKIYPKINQLKCFKRKYGGKKFNYFLYNRGKNAITLTELNVWFLFKYKYNKAKTWQWDLFFMIMKTWGGRKNNLQLMIKLEDNKHKTMDIAFDLNVLQAISGIFIRIIYFCNPVPEVESNELHLLALL